MKILKHERDTVGDFQKRAFLHIPIGIIIGASWLAHWSVPLILGYLFSCYEENEDGHTKDQAWKDYFGCLIGIVIGGVGSFLIKEFCCG
jgi:hypothetical protein